VTLGTTVRPPKAMRTWLEKLERKIADGLEEAIAKARRERILADVEYHEREAERLRRVAQDTTPDGRG
jgi:hypothetical protein